MGPQEFFGAVRCSKRLYFQHLRDAGHAVAARSNALRVSRKLKSPEKQGST
jgi:hypothetical protein